MVHELVLEVVQLHYLLLVDHIAIPNILQELFEILFASIIALLMYGEYGRCYLGAE